MQFLWIATLSHHRYMLVHKALKNKSFLKSLNYQSLVTYGLLLLIRYLKFVPLFFYLIHCTYTLVCTSLISDQHPLHTLDVAIIFSKCLASWHAARPMSSCQNNPSPSDPIDSVSRHFPPPSLGKSVSLLCNEMWRVRWTLSTATRLHRIRWSPLADIFHLLLYPT